MRIIEIVKEKECTIVNEPVVNVEYFYEENGSVRFESCKLAAEQWTKIKEQCLVEQPNDNDLLELCSIKKALLSKRLDEERAMVKETRKQLSLVKKEEDKLLAKKTSKK